MRGLNSYAIHDERTIARIRKLQSELPPARIPTEDELRAEKRARTQDAANRHGDFAPLRALVILGCDETQDDIQKARNALAIRLMVLREVRTSDRKEAVSRGVEPEMVAIERMQASILKDEHFIDRARKDAEIERVLAACIAGVDTWAPGLREHRLRQLQQEYEFRKDLRGAIHDGATDAAGRTVRNAEPSVDPNLPVITAMSVVPTDECLAYIRDHCGRPECVQRDPQMRRPPAGTLIFDPAGGGGGVFMVASAEGVLP